MSAALTSQAPILLADDDPAVLASLNDTLRGNYRTRVATSGEQAIASQIACFQHEKWNGRGSPEGFSGEAMPHEDALAIIREDRGLQFDPSIVDCFIEREDQMRAIAREYADHEHH